MSARPNVSSSRPHTRTHSHTHSHNTTILPTVPIQRTTSRPGVSSRPGTPSRGDIPSRISSTNLRRPSSPSRSQNPHTQSSTMLDHPATPTLRKPRKPRKGAKTSQQRQASGLDDSLGGQEDESCMLGVEQEPSSEDEETLFDLLGVTTPAKELPAQSGMLALPREDMDLALGRPKKGRKGKQDRGLDPDLEVAGPSIGGAEGSPATARRGVRKLPQHAGLQEADKRLSSEGEVKQNKSGRRGKKTSKSIVAQSNDITGTSHLEIDSSSGLPIRPSGIGATRPRGGRHAQIEEPENQPFSGTNLTAESPFDVSGLSKSLPSGGLAQNPKPQNSLGRLKKANKKGVDSGDESAVWDMPEVAGGQELTWQQKLQSQSSTPNESTPRRSAKSAPSDRKSKSSKSTSSTMSSGHTQVPAHPPAVSSPLNPRTPHPRRLSLDGVPATSAPVTRSISAFDSFIPYHTGFNVHRAPQTPAKSVASANGNLLGTQQNNSLPIVGSGEFPRLHGAGQDGQERKGSLDHGTGMGMKYAGPTFHNSPHAATLSKPDMEDF
ncbi:hypothetical protein IAR55_004814 [Kwoniella newhampshirensis]|uniref:Mif2 N-terminal domain-containing protein n=1 Tax=Kwoniella newhampshirensis TaxID=1651941 RepID=A0AAW0YWR1_9TREE